MKTELQDALWHTLPADCRSELQRSLSGWLLTSFERGYFSAMMQCFGAHNLFPPSETLSSPKPVGEKDQAVSPKAGKALSRFLRWLCPRTCTKT